VRSFVTSKRECDSEWNECSESQYPFGNLFHCHTKSLRAALRKSYVFASLERVSVAHLVDAPKTKVCTIDDQRKCGLFAFARAFREVAFSQLGC